MGSAELDAAGSEGSPSAPRLHPPAVFICGSPRSGTTLVRRLSCELPDVNVTNETHFLDRFFRRPEWQAFPLDEATLRDIAARLRLGLRGTIDAERLVMLLGGSAGSPRDLFTGIVHAMGDGSPILGEKTPRHIHHWRRLHDWYPRARFVVLVRDPRQQVASQRQRSWGTRSVPLAAALWREDNAHVLDLLQALGPDLVLVVNHDDAVRESDATRTRIADFLGVRREPLRSADPLEASTGDEEAFKAIDAARATRRVDELTTHQRKLITAICGRQMVALGFDPQPSYPAPLGNLACWSATAWRLVTQAAARFWHLVRRGPRKAIQRLRGEVRSR